MSYNLLVSLTMPSNRKGRGNKKTGPIPVSTVTAHTCPDICPFKNKKGCYAEAGPLAIHWRKVTEGKRGMDWDTFCNSVSEFKSNQLWRYAQSGDLPNHLGFIDKFLLDQLVEANKGKRGFGYTHHDPSLGKNGLIIKSANENGFTINLSGNNLEHADKLKSLKVGPVVTVLPSTVNGKETPTVMTPAGNKVVVCPATYREGVTCSSCALCQKANRSCIVGFPAHGSMKKRADKSMSK